MVLSDSVQVNSVGWDPRLEGMTQDVIHIKDPSGPGTKPLTALQAKYLTMPNRANPILVVCTSGGLVVGFVFYKLFVLNLNL